MVYLKRMAISFSVLFFLMVAAAPFATALSFADYAGSGYDVPQPIQEQPMIEEPVQEPSAQEPSEPAIPQSDERTQPEECPPDEENPQSVERPETEEQTPDIPQEESKEPAPDTESSYPMKEKAKGKSNLSPGFLRNLYKK